MRQVMETLESRQMFSVALAEPTALPADTSAPIAVDPSDPSGVVPSKTTPKLAAACCKGKTFSRVEINVT